MTGASAHRDFAGRLRRHAGALIGACALIYFGYHLLLGERGLAAWLRKADQLAEAQAELAQAQGAERELAHLVDLMRPESLDPDMLDEQVRINLGYVRPDEVVIYDGTSE